MHNRLPPCNSFSSGLLMVTLPAWAANASKANLQIKNSLYFQFIGVITLQLCKQVGDPGVLFLVLQQFERFIFCRIVAQVCYQNHGDSFSGDKPSAGAPTWSLTLLCIMILCSLSLLQANQPGLTMVWICPLALSRRPARFFQSWTSVRWLQALSCSESLSSGLCVQMYPWILAKYYVHHRNLSLRY